MNDARRFKHHNRKGFTLVELMIGMVVLMIGVLATMAMQTSALAGYSATRDGTTAADLGRTIEQMIKAEAIGWVGVNFNMPGQAYKDFEDGLTSTSTALGNSSILNAVNGDQWNWKPLTLKATDYNLSTNGPQRFCAYVNGGQRSKNSSIGDADVTMMMVQIAVVYPAARGVFADNECPDADTLDLDANNTDALELNGWRASFFATQVYPRGT